ncbi:hypothetical protein [Enterococcus wangshanyuanii]|uniref:Uncharacterized protein n=1 Tax=Enterococcus wangshanyuanii TaxID=2005703 RepID=A0ABQ1PX07_9ENTE|nr:hypothetical protein [Enterococcus wangshanyuanii]GGD05582.1 hypothetical protein GCM10011573_38770 [Enterococcus wangshanyuanii]
MKNKLESLINRINRFSERHKKAIKGVKIFLLLFFIAVMGYVVYLSHGLLAVMAIYNGIADKESLASLVKLITFWSFMLVGVMWCLIFKLYSLLVKK